MSRKSLIHISFYSVCWLVLIFDSKTAIREASCAIELCIKTLIPSIFPLIFLSMLLTPEIAGINSKILRWTGKKAHIPSGAEHLYLIGIMGGYPVGAQTIGISYRNGFLSKSQAEHMLSFCSNAGPAFFFGILTSFFSKHVYVWILWGIHVLSSFLVGVACPADDSKAQCLYTSKREKPSEILIAACQAMASICGWVILFRIVLGFCDRWFLWALPDYMCVCIAGAVELSNGCIQLELIQSESTRFLLAAVMLAFGGTCVIMQTASVIGNLSLRPYIIGKLLQTAFSILLADSIRRIVFPTAFTLLPLIINLLFLILILAFMIGRGCRKNRYSILSTVRV